MLLHEDACMHWNCTTNLVRTIYELAMHQRASTRIRCEMGVTESNVWVDVADRKL